MKKIIAVNLVLLLSAALTSCEKFLDRLPQSEVTEDKITFTQTELRLLSNQFYLQLPGYVNGGYDAGIYWLDNASDNMTPGNYAFNSQLSGTITVPASGGGWDWSQVRSVNFLINKLKTSAPGDVPVIVDHYLGEFYFWRAYFYFNLLKQFGDLPWIDHPLTTESPELFDERLPRNVIVDRILADLDLAASTLRSSSAVTNSRISKEVALLFKSRVALYEGTWEKYHAGTVFGAANADPAKYFRASIDAVQHLMQESGSTIVGGQNPYRDYWHIFNQVDYSSNAEVLLWKKFNVNAGLSHYSQIYMQERGGNTGLSKQLVESYLCTDGKPIGVSSLYQGDASVEQLAQHRDPRLSQTIYLPGHIRQINGSDTVRYYLPNLTQDGEYGNRSGYQLYKGLDPDYQQRDRSWSGSIAFRYAEALLNYAEAAEELGECTQNVLDQTINKLRDRVGMPHLTVGVGFTDPSWDFPMLSPLLNEIRRERRVELACEGYRFDDLMRWAAADMIQRPVLGAKYSQYENENFSPALVAGNIPVNNDGYIAPYLNSPAANGRQFDPVKHYLKPIPSNETTTNPALKQNPNY